MPGVEESRTGPEPVPSPLFTSQTEWRLRVSDVEAPSDPPRVGITREEMAQAVQQWLPLIRKLCWKVARGDRELVEQLVQETAIVALDNFENYDASKGAVSTWLGWRVRNAHRNLTYHRRKKARNEVAWPTYAADDGDEIAMEVPVEATQDDDIDRQQTKALVLAALQTLPERQRQILMQRSEGLTLSEIAKEQGVTVERIRQIEAKAQGVLRKRITNGNVTPLRPSAPPARRFTEKPVVNPTSVRSLAEDHPAMKENRTLFPTRVVDVTESAPDRLLVSGHNNRKLGDVVAKGRFKGYALYGLSLEERATCPTDCAVRAVCYGNAMHMARRHRITDDALFFRRLESEVGAIIDEHGGALVRLHVLGDFPSVDYVHDWMGLLERHEKLAIYGYTSRKQSDEIGAAIDHVKQRYPDRFRIRWSNTRGADGAIVIDSETTEGAIVCPAQTDATACCASCGLCWEDRSQTIAFIKHGPKSAEVQAEAEMKAATVADATSTEGKPRRVQAIALPRVQQAKPGQPPEAMWATPTDLFIEGAYQRDLSKRSITHIRKMVTQWDWAKYKPPICAKRHGVLCVVDGQHTAIAAATLGIVRIPVLVVRADEIEARAEAFVSHNRDRLNMSVFQIFYASVTAGDRTAIAILKAAEATGAIIPRSPPGRNAGKPGQIIDIRDITRYANNDGIAMVERIFRIAVAAQCAPLGVTATRSLHLLLTEPYFAEAASWPDSRIANGLKTIAEFEATARAKGDENGQGQVRAGALMIMEACAIREVAA